MAQRQQSQAATALRRLRKPASSGLESAEGASAGLSSDRIRTSLKVTRERFRKIAERTTSGRETVTREQERVLADAETVLQRLSADGDQAEVTDRHLIALEAIVVPDGTRPALFVQDDDVDPAAETAGSWQGSISDLRVGIAVVSRSVGRINAAIGFPNYAGTGFVVAEGLVLTNRHVLEALAVGGNISPDGSWKFKKPVTIDFAAEFERTRTRIFKVTGVAFAGPDQIGPNIQLSKLDVALLTVETHNGTEPLPPPLALSRRLAALDSGSKVYVMGFPGRPYNEVGKVLMKVFQDEYFVKRFAPGYVEEEPDLVRGGEKRVFTHDASTLGGNSGSSVIEFHVQGRSVIGLHFGGVARQENYAHAIARIEKVLAKHGSTLLDN